MKLLAIEVNPTIPNLGIQAKPKSVKRKFEGTNVSMPAPPSKKVLAELDSSMVEHGELETGILCVPITIEMRVEGKLRTTEAHSRKFTLVDIRQRLLNRHEKYMRLHSEKDIVAKRSLWMWHDHSSLASHGIIAVMVGVVYNPVLFCLGLSLQVCKNSLKKGRSISLLMEAPP